MMTVTFDTLKAATRLSERAGLAGRSERGSAFPWRSTSCSDAETVWFPHGERDV